MSDWSDDKNDRERQNLLPVLQQLWDERKQKEHQHQFVIPVEWKPEYRPGKLAPFKYRITTLRCACGEEIDR